MNKQRLFMILALIPLLFGNNCGRWSADVSADAGVQDSASIIDPGSNSAEDAPSAKALLNFEQVYTSMLNLTGQITATAAQNTAYAAVAGPLSDNSTLTSYSAPVLLGMNTLSGEVCNGLIIKEAALAADQRRFFNTVDFTKAVGMVTRQTYLSATDKMSQIFLSRALKSEETLLFNSYYDEFVAAIPVNEKNQTKHTKSLMLGTCAALLSSFDAMTF